MRATLLALLICVFSLIAVPHSAAASTTQTINYSGQGGYADFQSISGCVETDTYVYAAQTMSQGNAGGPPPGPGVSVNIFQWDNGAQTQLMAAFGFATPTTLQMDRKLSSGTVTATVPMQDYVSNNTFTVSVNVSWTGTGPGEPASLHEPLPGTGV